MPQSKRGTERKPKALPPQQNQHNEGARGGIYTCPPIIRDVQAVSDAELKRWAIAILDLIGAGVINYSWVTLARMLHAKKIVAVKLANQQQSLGLLHACGRVGVEVLQRKFEEPGEANEPRVVFCVVRADSVDQIPLRGVYGAGTTAARKLLEDGAVDVDNEQLARRTAMAARKLLPNEYPAVYKQFTKEKTDTGEQRRRVVFVERNPQGGFTLRLADRLRELIDKTARK